MEIAQWWPKVPEPTRVWLVQNNGSELPPEVRADIAAAGGPTAADLTDDDVDWIEAIANDEDPA